MRAIDYIVIHCSASPFGRDDTIEDVRAWHVLPKERGGPGFRDVGYHFVIRRDGTLELGRPLDQIGAHVSGWNSHSIGICYIGGLGPRGEPADTRTPEQVTTMVRLLRELQRYFPRAKIRGHRDFPGVRKACPCFDVRSWWEAVDQEAA